MITNLRKLNNHCAAPKFRNEDINTVRDLIQPNDQLVTVDVKNGFYRVSIHEDFRDYLGIYFEGVYYRWTVLPFGLNCSPHFFNKALCIEHLTSLGLRVTVFVDDFLLMSKASHSAVDKGILPSTLSRLGIQINKEKSSLTPQHNKTYIGFIVSTEGEAPIISIPHNRIYKLKKEIKRVLSKTSVSARTLARVAGQCIAMTKAIIPGKLLLENVYCLLATRSTWEDMLLLNTSATEDLQWWLDSLQNWNGHPLQVRPPQGQMFTDVSHLGWGAVYGLKEAAGHWNLQMSFEHSNYRELIAVLMALKSFGPSMKEKSIQILSDKCDHSGIYQSSWRSQLRSERYSKGYLERGI